MSIDPHTARPPRRLDRIGEVLSLVRTGRARTVGELAVTTGLARSTVGARVDRLLARGVLRAVVASPAQRGRPPTVLEFAPDAGVVLAAHLGMTGARIAAVDLAGTVLADAGVQVPIERGPDAVLDLLTEELAALVDRTGRSRADIWGIGVGLPSAVDLSGAPARSGTWDGEAVSARLSTEFGAPALVDHDLKLLSMGEQRACWPDTEVLLCVKVGTVIGCGIVIDGRPVRGAQSLAGEIGHTLVPGRDALCRCGNAGCLNAVAGGAALATALAAAGLPAEHASDVAALARSGVPAAVRAVRAAGRDIGAALSGAVNLLNPSVIALWGYLVAAEEPLFAGIRESIYQHSLPAATRNLQLVRARMGDNAGVQGAALMVLDHVLSPEMVERLLLSGDRTG